MNLKLTSMEDHRCRFTPPCSTDANHIYGILASRTEALKAVRPVNRSNRHALKLVQLPVSSCICCITSLAKVQYFVDRFERNLPGPSIRHDLLLIGCLVSDWQDESAHYSLDHPPTHANGRRGFIDKRNLRSAWSWHNKKGITCRSENI